jgi:hypothetical protein
MLQLELSSCSVFSKSLYISLCYRSYPLGAVVQSPDRFVDINLVAEVVWKWRTLCDGRCHGRLEKIHTSSAILRKTDNKKLVPNSVASRLIEEQKDCCL